MIENLPPKKQAALSLALFEGLTGEELAAALGMRMPAAMKLLRSALRDVGKTLGSQLPGLGEA
jgi:DNA-directed RNA polymerase specialized sigma24 family protein